MNTLHLTSDKLVKRRDIILLDDVITTGHTIQACYKTLMQGNPNRIAIVVLANTPRAEETTPEELEELNKLLDELFN